jgi:large subunit ribosomal protein L32
MALPKKKLSRARRGKRRAHMALVAKNRSVCPRCGRDKMPHRACGHCGFYKGKEVVYPKA